MVTITLQGSKELVSALGNMSDDVRQAVSAAVVGTAMELRGDVVKSIQRGPKTGRVYQKSSPKRAHQASAPGQAPATDTGRLANSITFDQIGDLTATVGSKLAYSLYLEFGTRNIAARPFFRPAVEKMRPKFIKRLERAVGMVVK